MRLFLLLPLFLWSCTESPDAAQQTPGQGLQTAADGPSAKPETSFAPSVATDWEIIPGKRIGNTALGDDPQNLIQRLGPPDASDAAMGKAWLVWNGKSSNNTLAVFTGYADSNMIRKEIRQIRITSPRFQTTAGVHTGLKFPEIQTHFPDGSLQETDFGKGYAVAGKGIYFEFSQTEGTAICTAILVYPNSGSPTAYLPFPH